ncbi:VOC family protein [Glaciihabitans sp. dw_435]|uniref:VOC family protein n=1 Tax=Glaciihabitans sp. dw_435 TaxID=2720081 RepID=UPI001BD674C3|nr:VOC family protein [Glaciihabitans sp. dw_435]
MAPELLAVTFRTPDPQRDAKFWGAVLDRRAETDRGGVVLAGGGGQVGLRFVAGPARGDKEPLLHLHLSEAGRSQNETIAACLRFGARLRGSGHVREGEIAYLSDVAGGDFCVIEGGNSYLAGAGPLGEVTCDGTRAVGQFWSRALGWPLVWEEGDETAIQSPAGGTKLAWSGDPVDPNTDRERQYFVLTVAATQLEPEVDRLITLGASDRAVGDRGDVTLRDPDGTAFVVRTTAG